MIELTEEECKEFDKMTKRSNTVQHQKCKVVRTKLRTIIMKIQKLIDEYEANTNRTNNAENLLCCLTNAKIEIEEACENYTDFL